jgi:hypothetical protein
MELVIKASLHVLVEPPKSANDSNPRELLSTVCGDWTDDARAWYLAKHLIPEAEAYLAEVERRAAQRPDDEDLWRLRGRARYAHIIAVALYRELRVPARRRS